MVEPIRVLHVVGSLGIGGIQSYLKELYFHIDRSKVQFDFVVHIKAEQSYENTIKTMGANVFYVDDDAFEKKAWGNYIKFWKHFFRKHTEYKIVHGHLRSTMTIYLWEARKAGCYTIAHSHSTTNGYGKAALIKDSLQFPVRYIADFFMGCSKEANIWMFGNRIANSQKCIVLRNGIDVDMYSFREDDRTTIRKELGYQYTDIVIGTVGRLVAQKNQIILVKTLMLLNNHYKLLLVGDGPLRQKIQEEVELNKLEDRVKFLGNRSDVYKLLSAMDIFALPSRNEGLGIAAIEAQASGLPTLLSKAIPRDAYVTAFSRCVDGGETPNSWAEEISHITFDKRETASKQVSDAGYSITKVAENLQNFYLGVSK